MADAGMRARVKRLLHDEFRPDDIITLYRHLRSRSRGRGTVREMGDFLAHPDRRTKGLAVRQISDWFLYIRFRLLVKDHKVPIDNLPMNFGEVLRASFGQTRDPILTRDTGLKRKTIERALPRIIDHLKPNAIGGLTGETITDPVELAIISCLIGYERGPTLAFTEERLVNEFRDALINDNLLESEEAKLFRKLDRAVSLTAVAIMHQTIIDMRDGTTAKLTTMPEGSADGTITTFAGSGIHYPPVGDLTLNGAIYNTSLLAAECCEATLLAKASPVLECPIEVTAAQMLAEVA